MDLAFKLLFELKLAITSTQIGAFKYPSRCYSNMSTEILGGLYEICMTERPNI